MAPSTASREHLNPFTISENTVRSAPYTYRAPSPPFIHIPVPQRSEGPRMTATMELLPSFENIDPTNLTTHDLHILTGSSTQIALDPTENWTYEKRRQAQPIVNYLYLGPTSVVRDHEFLQREGITMILVVRPSGIAHAKSLIVETASKELGIPALYMHVAGPHDLIRGFTEIIRLINQHLLSVYHIQNTSRHISGQVDASSEKTRRGKVLVTCESGNDRSAAVVAAYIMSAFGKEMVPTLQFITLQRFCCSFDEDTKRILQSWEDILSARSAVAQYARDHASEPTEPDQKGQASTFRQSPTIKRSLDDMMQLDSNDCRAIGQDSATDLERFTDRDQFVPFTDATSPFV